VLSGGWPGVIAALLVVPVVLALLDLSGGLRARRFRCGVHRCAPVDDFEVLVPIYGAMTYLENAEYLARYGSRVILCTTTTESRTFYRDLAECAQRYGFRVFRAHVPRTAAGTGKRATSGTVRDRIIRDAHAEVRATWVVCLDADTTTTRPLDELVGTMATRGLDLASIRLVPSNLTTGLARIQAHEYRMAMMLRRILPWLVSGACHAARAEVHRAVMNRHSLFFQGNDVELGVLAEALGYHVGHVPFEVPTTVPETLRPWFRQRLAWAGGEVRLFVMNPQLALKHPIFWTYGCIIAIAAFPFRWNALAHAGLVIGVVLAAYTGLCLFLHRGHWDRWLLVLPLYAALSSLVLTPLGLIWYVRMAVSDRNLGLIRARAGRRRPATADDGGDEALRPRAGAPSRSGAVDCPLSA